MSNIKVDNDKTITQQDGKTGNIPAIEHDEGEKHGDKKADDMARFQRRTDLVEIEVQAALVLQGDSLEAEQCKDTDRNGEQCKIKGIEPSQNGDRPADGRISSRPHT